VVIFLSQSSPWIHQAEGLKITPKHYFFNFIIICHLLQGIKKSIEKSEKIVKNCFEFENSLLGVFNCSFQSPIKIGKYCISINICDEIHKISSIPIYLNVLKIKDDTCIEDQKSTDSGGLGGKRYVFL
jgi:hypothetical protein